MSWTLVVVGGNADAGCTHVASRGCTGCSAVQPYRCSDVVVSMGTVISPRFPARNHSSYTALPHCRWRYRGALHGPNQPGSNDRRPTATTTTFSRARHSGGSSVSSVLSRRPALSAVSPVFSAVSCLRCVLMGRRPLQTARVVHRFFSFIVRGIDRQY